MGNEVNQCAKHGQQLRSLEARVKDNETKIDNFAISLTENTTITKHLDTTMTEFSGAVHSLEKTLTKVDLNLSHLAESLQSTNNKVKELEKNTNKKFVELKDKMCDEEAKNKIDIRAIGKNILVYFLLPSTIIAAIATIVLLIAGTV